jgi:hypothetical protein
LSGSRENIYEFFNNPDWRYEDYFFQELVPFIEANYRVVGDKNHRAVAGLSMGGGGDHCLRVAPSRTVLRGLFDERLLVPARQFVLD